MPKNNSPAADRFPMWPVLRPRSTISQYDFIRSSGLPHLAGLSGLTNFRLNRMDLPCSRCSLWLHAGGTNPGSTACHSLCCAACDFAFPFERQGRLLRSRSISGLFSRSLYSGLQPPCLRFAVAVIGHHARLGTRLLARLYRGRHLRRRRSTHLQGATLTEPDMRATRPALWIVGSERQDELF